MSQPKVSIIVPVYNAEKYLERSVSSLTNQTLKDIEIILVDDGSTDSSLEMCNKAAEKDPRIKVFHKSNEGAGKARNAGLGIATGEYIGFVDSDDFADADMFATLYEKALEYDSDLVISGVKFIGGNMFSDDRALRKTYFEKDTHFDTADSLKELKMGIVGATPEDTDDSKYGMSVWRNLFRHRIIKDNSLSFRSEREVMSEDALFMLEFISCINKATGIDAAFYNYCRNEDSISKAYKADRFEKSLVFVNEVEKQFQKDNIAPHEYLPYIHRFWQAMCRVLCSMEIMHSRDKHIPYSALRKNLKAVCTHPLTFSTLNSYPIHKLPFMQAVFAFGVKHKLYFMLKVLIILRSR